VLEYAGRMASIRVLHLSAPTVEPAERRLNALSTPPSAAARLRDMAGGYRASRVERVIPTNSPRAILEAVRRDETGPRG
jgi:hypothetical protein